MEWLDVIETTNSDDDAEACTTMSEHTATSNHTEHGMRKKPKAKIIGRRIAAWTREEDTELQRLLLKHGADWEHLASHFPDRTPECLQARWESTSGTAWTSAQDRKLKNLVQLYGSNWKELSKQLGRPASEVKARHFQLQKQMDLEEFNISLDENHAVLEKEKHLSELYQQIDIMQHYLLGLQSEMNKLQTDLSQSLDD